MRNMQLEDHEIEPDLPFEQRLDIQTPQTVRLRGWIDANMPCASLDYDFSHGDKIVLSRIVDLGFDANRSSGCNSRSGPTTRGMNSG